MESKRKRIQEWLQSRSPAEVTEALQAELQAACPDISERTLRAVLRESGFPLAATVEGVRQDTLDGLERTLLALLAEYEKGDAARRRQVREIVIVAKQHAAFARKEEVILWTRTWLENPPLFRAWVELRKRVLAAGISPQRLPERR
jgi:hypothetical protein